MTDKTLKRALTFDQWSIINRALCGARLEMNGKRPRNERLETSLSEAVEALNDFEEIS